VPSRSNNTAWVIKVFLLRNKQAACSLFFEFAFRRHQIHHKGRLKKAV
jgi:hypothetical protein